MWGKLHAVTAGLVVVVGSAGQVYGQVTQYSPYSQGTPSFVLPAYGTPTTGAPTTGPSVSSMEVTAFSSPLASDPYFQPKGIPLEGGEGSAFRLFPNLSTSVSYDDNVYRTTAAHASDYFFTVTPTAVLDYNTASARMDLYASSNWFEYVRLGNVDTNNYQFGSTGSYEVSREISLTGNIGYALLSEPLSSPNVVGFQERPSQYDLFNINVQGKYKPNRFALTVGYVQDDYSFLNTPLIGGGELGNKDRDNNSYEGFVEASYDVALGYTTFLRATYNDDHYLRYFDRTGTHRSSDGYTADAGFRALVTDLMVGELYLGYQAQNYDEHQAVPLRDAHGLDFGANLTWFPTNVLTVHLGATKTLDNTTLALASAGDDRNITLDADYAITRRVQLIGSITYDDTQFVGITRDDRTWVAGGQARWLLTHYVSLYLDYAYSTRSSTLALVNYDDNLVTLGLNLQI